MLVSSLISLVTRLAVTKTPSTDGSIINTWHIHSTRVATWHAPKQFFWICGKRGFFIAPAEVVHPPGILSLVIEDITDAQVHRIEGVILRRRVHDGTPAEMTLVALKLEPILADCHAVAPRRQRGVEGRHPLRPHIRAAPVVVHAVSWFADFWHNYRT
jgi:hypothetical protein